MRVAKNFTFQQWQWQRTLPSRRCVSVWQRRTLSSCRWVSMYQKRTPFSNERVLDRVMLKMRCLQGSHRCLPGSLVMRWCLIANALFIVPPSASSERDLWVRCTLLSVYISLPPFCLFLSSLFPLFVLSFVRLSGFFVCSLVVGFLLGLVSVVTVVVSSYVFPLSVQFVSLHWTSFVGLVGCFVVRIWLL